MAKRQKRRRTHPEGLRDTATNEWKAMVRRELESRGMTQAELAKRLGRSPAAISRLLSSSKKRSTRSSKLVGPVSAVLDLPAPVPVITSELQKQWNDALDGLTDDEAEMLIRQARALVALRLATD
jgi:transcriptional regulator with XRE-family HTH domain